MTEQTDLDVDPIPTPIECADAAIHELLQENPNALAGDLEPRRLAAAALGASMSAYVPPDRPVDITVSISHDDGLEVEQALHLTREQAARPEVLGTAVGHAAASALAGFHITDDGTAGDDARIAAATALDAR